MSGAKRSGAAAKPCKSDAAARLGFQILHLIVFLEDARGADDCCRPASSDPRRFRLRPQRCKGQQQSSVALVASKLAQNTFRRHHAASCLTVLDGDKIKRVFQLRSEISSGQETSKAARMDGQRRSRAEVDGTCAYTGARDRAQARPHGRCGTAKSLCRGRVFQFEDARQAQERQEIAIMQQARLLPGLFRRAQKRPDPTCPEKFSTALRYIQTDGRFDLGSPTALLRLTRQQQPAYCCSLRGSQ